MKPRRAVSLTLAAALTMSIGCEAYEADDIPGETGNNDQFDVGGGEDDEGEEDDPIEIQRLAEIAGMATGLVVVDGDVYWATAKGVGRAAEGGGAAVELSGRSAIGLTAAGGEIYWVEIDPDDLISRVWAWDGSAVRLVHESQALELLVDLAVDETHLYLGHRNSQSHVSTVPRAGGEKAVVTGAALGMSSNLERITADDDAIYWTLPQPSDSAILTVPKAGGTPELVAFGQARPIGIVVAGERICWVNQGTFNDFGHNQDGTVKCVAKSGGQIEILAHGLWRPGDLIHANGWLYWTNLGTPRGHEGSVMGVPARGGEVVVIADEQQAPGAVAADSEHVYWATGAGWIDGAVFRRAR